MPIPLPSHDPAAYSVELSSRAWRQVGSVTSVAFALIRSAIDVVASQAASQVRDPGNESGGERSAPAGDYRVVYTRDDTRRVIFVLTIVQDVDENR